MPDLTQALRGIFVTYIILKIVSSTLAFFIFSMPPLIVDEINLSTLNQADNHHELLTILYFDNQTIQNTLGYKTIIAAKKRLKKVIKQLSLRISKINNAMHKVEESLRKVILKSLI